jgi:hypothetical protein
MRELGLQEPTRAELRAQRKQIRNQAPKLTPEQVDINAYCQPIARERCPRGMPARRPAGWTAIHFVLPRRTIEGLTLLTKYMAAREQAERSEELHGFRRRYPKTENYFVVQALNCLLEEHGLSQFCVEEAEQKSGRVRRFAVTT